MDFKVPMQDKKFFVLENDYGSNHYKVIPQIYSSYNEAQHHKTIKNFHVKDCFIVGFKTLENAQTYIRNNPNDTI